jgi:hypothetical protein
MKNLKNWQVNLSICLLLAVAFVYGNLFQIKTVHAQSFGIGPIVASVSQCPVIPASSGQAFLCPVGTTTSGAWYTNWGAGWVLLVPQSPTGGVTSFNGRTGVVVSATGDYSASQITNGVVSVFGRTGTVVATTGDYSYSQISGTMPFTYTNCPNPTFTGTTGLTFGTGCK